MSTVAPTPLTASPAPHALAPSQAERQRLAGRVRLLSWASLGYMALEGGIAILAGILAGSVALIGFGLDSAIEGFASAIIVWRWASHRINDDKAERRAQKLVALQFFVLAPYVGYESLAALIESERPDVSWLGIALSASSLMVMPYLGIVKQRLADQLGSAATKGEGRQNLLCAYLAGALLIGLLGNLLFGTWWLDPIVGLLIAAVAVKEGLEAWRGEGCACVVDPLAGIDDGDHCADPCCSPDPRRPVSRMSTETRYVPAAGRAAFTRLYDPVMGATMRERSFRKRLRDQVLGRLPAHGTVVDIGCGTGTFAIALATTRSDATVLGIDGDETVLAIAARKPGADRVKWRRGLAGELPLPAASADAVVMSLLLHHLDTDAKRAALTDAAKVLGPGGTLHIADWGRPRDPVIRGAVGVLQLIDGIPNPRDHAAGRLPAFIAEAGFSHVVTHDRLRTAWGSLELLSARPTAPAWRDSAETRCSPVTSPPSCSRAPTASPATLPID